MLCMRATNFGKAIVKNARVIYTFDNQIRIQTKGGTIGLELNEVLAEVFMMWLDEELSTRLQEKIISQKMKICMWTKSTWRHSWTEQQERTDPQ